jgi:hypothetical protein
MGYEDELEPPAFVAWLESTDFEWLEKIVFDEIPLGGLGRRQADLMMRLAAVYRAAREEFPSMSFSWEINCCLVNLVPDDSAMEMGEESGASWRRELPQVVAAAALGRAGKLSTVLVAVDLLSNGYLEFSGDGQSLLVGYSFPASVASYTAAAVVGTRLHDVPVGPGWWYFGDEGESVEPTQPDPFTWIANKALSVGERRDAIGGLNGFGVAGWGWQLRVLLAARASNVEEEFLDEQDRQEAYRLLELFEADLRNAISGDDFQRVCRASFDDWGLEVALRAALFARHVDDLLDEAQGVPVDDSHRVAALHERHRWIHTWGFGLDGYSTLLKGSIDPKITVRFIDSDPPSCSRSGCEFCGD